jgi:trans-aconitate methyltransferase
VTSLGGDHWRRYNEGQLGRRVRPLCARALRAAGPGAGRLAVDFGCGAGVETAALLTAGWRVLAIDGDAVALDGLADTEGLQTACADLARAPLPPTDLFYAGYSLPFVAPDAFDEVWSRIRAALRPGAWLAVDLFGDRDSWAANPDLTIHDRAGVDARLDGLVDVEVDEEDRDGSSFGGVPKHWHVFHVLARRPE